MLEPFSATVGKLYQAAAGAVSWREALVAVEDLTGGAGAVIDLIPKDPGEAGKTLAGSFSEENCSEYAQNYQSICPRIQHAIRHPEQDVQYDYLFMDEASMDRDPVYDWFGRYGLRYYFGSVIGDTARFAAFLSVQRTRRQGHVDAAGINLFRLLRPHILRAATLADELGTLRSQQRFGSAMLEALPQAVFALDAHGRVLFANRAGSCQLATGDGLSISEGRLRTACLTEQSRLDTAIRGALGTLTGTGAWIRVSRPSGAPPLALFVAPLEVGDEQLMAAEAKLLVMVHDTAEHRCARVDMLTGVYGLTETEARLASALSGGHSLESAAALLGMKLSTARSHLKAVFRKMGVGRQQDLVRVLASIAMIAPPV